MFNRLIVLNAIAVPLLLGADAAARMPVLVELFTSQGCSSCPPADKVLAKLESENVIVLSEHVDYWNQLGWKDPFSSRQYSLRQTEYGRLFGMQGVYTPQMVINGRVELIGSNERLAQREVEKAAQADLVPASVRISLEEIGKKNVAVFSLAVDGLPQLNEGDTPQVWLAITESGITTRVMAGENTGRRLSHAGVVRTLVQASEMKREEKGYRAMAKVTLQYEWKLERLKAVLFVQEKNSKRVLGASSVKLVRSDPGQ
jgi:hypothetical protein